MYTVIKRIEVAGSHQLALDYDSPCANLHGHNWVIVVKCQSEKLDKHGMVIDFAEIKRIVKQLDHHNFNEILSFNPTSENIAKWLCEQIPNCVEVSVQESEGNVAIFNK